MLPSYPLSLHVCPPTQLSYRSARHDALVVRALLANLLLKHLLVLEQPESHFPHGEGIHEHIATIFWIAPQDSLHEIATEAVQTQLWLGKRTFGCLLGDLGDVDSATMNHSKAIKV